MVRAAFVTSVTWVFPPVRFQTSHESTVPKRSSPFSALSLAPETFSRIQRTFVALKYASMMSPVFERITSVNPFALRLSQYGAVLRSCQTIALWTGSPVAASHTMVVSRWFVIPIAARSAPPIPIFFNASTATSFSEDQISIGSCSTRPGLGKYWVNSFCATLMIDPALSKTMAREELVPWSRAKM